MSTLDAASIQARNEQLQAVASDLKSAFVGIDHVIDELIDGLRVWFLMPEALTRPIVISLWGMTGVGKTDLVRKLVKGLGYQDRFVEIQMAKEDRFTRSLSVTSVLDANSLNDSDPKILMFDELQRFRSINKKGEPNDNTGFADFWELLSDGRLSRRERRDMEILLAEMMIERRDRERDRKAGKEVDDGSTLEIWDAQSLKKTLQMDESILDILDMSESDIMDRVQAAMRTKQIFEPVDHSKTLILISGNLDEAFAMAGMTAESDVDADIFHAFTQKVTLVDIKQALSQRFLPEQVARFGNVHLIYSSLRRADFETLIGKEVERIQATTKRLFDIDVTVTPAVESLIYRNGVFPAQGTRPVFSSVADILESRLSRMILEARMHDEHAIALDYDQDAQQVVATFDDAREVRLDYVGRLDRVRELRTHDLLANVAVHESGHAIVYAVRFGLAPLQLTAKVASTETGGFTFPHEIYKSRESMLAQIQVYVAGGLAEELVFGADHASAGRRSDWSSATELALDYVRRFGFGTEFQADYTLEDEHEMNKDVTDVHVEALMAKSVEATRSLLQHFGKLLAEMSRALQAKGKIEAEEVQALAEKHGVTAAVQPEGYRAMPAYAEALERFEG